MSINTLLFRLCQRAGCGFAMCLATMAAGQDTGDEDLLAGPKVEHEATIQNGGRQGLVPGQRRQAEALPLRLWMNAVRELQLTDEQRQQVQAIATEFQDAQRRHQRRNGEELRRLQQAVREARESGKEPDSAVREALQRIEAETPRQTDSQRRIWAVLDESQQAHLRARVASLEQEAQQRRRGGDAPQRPNEMMSAESMQPREDAMAETRDDMMSTPAASRASDTPREQMRERRRAAEGTLDANARRRVEFLESRQVASTAGNAPSAEERSFQFEETADR